MRILYGVQGTGNGHITRARVMATELARRGVQVDFLFSGRAPQGYFDMAVFGDFQTRPGLTFVARQGRISLVSTLLQSRPARLIRDIQTLPVKDYDLVVNDFEPVTAWAARRAGVPSVGVSHQAAFLKAIPKEGESLGASLLMRHFAPTDIQLGVHWHHFGQSLLPPIIEHRRQHGPVRSDKIIVYLPFESPTAIAALLAPFPHVEFYCYHPEVSPEDRGHLHFRAPSRQGFHRDLADAAGVISNGGFELSSEALCLGKKLLLKPLQGQFEQGSNVLTLRQLGLATSMHRLSTSTLDAWLTLPPAKPVSYPPVAPRLVDWLLAGDWHSREALCRSLWQEVSFPDYCRLPG
ncbi:MJ1255/VC2487 family glycosyltransferase [Zobellella maritima]|uniref:MJ1255/VC2487 family glycosyltransferase n=1 Tax=Zobellella maritima TaxID=2059725 RepID=UPI000E30474A|nr:MJ1255/VC2487 family glycosyltransferase [Zobellella maritima]